MTDVASWPERADSEREIESAPARFRGLHASLWTLLGYGGGQALRLAGNLLLTRLLFREAFGLMALVNSLLLGLTIFSDVGIGLAIVRSRRRQERRFLDTAWTIQVLRGALLLVVSLIFAWPAARFYASSQLLLLVPLMGLNLLSGFNSTSLFTLNRRLDQRRLVLPDLGAQIFSLVVTVVWAVIPDGGAPSVWALMAGATCSFVVKLIASHVLFSDRRDRFDWEPEAARELVTFGGWIFLSSILTFCAARLDSLVLGKTLSIGELGTYSSPATLPGFRSRSCSASAQR